MGQPLYTGTGAPQVHLCLFTHLASIGTGHKFQGYPNSLINRQFL